MKGRVRRQTRPHAALEIIGAVLSNPLIDALRHLARDEPLDHPFRDARTHPLQDLDRRLVRDAFGQKLRNDLRSEEHTSELQSLMRISYAVFCLKKKK